MRGVRYATLGKGSGPHALDFDLVQIHWFHCTESLFHRGICIFKGDVGTGLRYIGNRCRDQRLNSHYTLLALVDRLDSTINSQ